MGVAHGFVSCLLMVLSLSCFPSVTQAGKLSLGDVKTKLDPKRAPKFFKPHSDTPSASTKEIRPRRQPFIIYMGSEMKYGGSPKSLYTSMLDDVIGSKGSGSKYLLRTYQMSFYGCVAMLTEGEAKAISEKEGVVSVFPNRKKKLDTTRSWDFMGLPMDATRNHNIESDIIVGVIDTGVWPESKSFDDTGLAPVPSRWKGTCHSSLNFTCNNKLIGARYFRSDGEVPESDEPSPRDTNGHGTHTASTAAGSEVHAADLFGFASGTARGGVPSARIAVYKVCWSDSCFDSDILAAFDSAIADGVDLLSVSLGSSFALNYFEDSIAIGSFHAMRNKIFTSVSAGNDGPSILSTANVAPWTLSVAASTIDRRFTTKVILGNGVAFKGASINPDAVYNRTLIYAGDAQNSSSTSEASFCDEGSLNRTLVDGKIVLCLGLNTGGGPLQAGASGMLMASGSTIDSPINFPLPAADIEFDDAITTDDFILSHKSPKGTILRSDEEKDSSAPFVASFSSRGPSAISPGILKPDIAAPGVSILAAWSPRSPPSIYEGDKRQVPYHIISGTSMACPHATGVAAYVKSFHPSWSPSAIKSAIMTSATPMNSSINEDAEFSYGAGHINPVKATYPGLVYDAGEEDYTNFLCGEGYDTSSIQIITGDNTITCPKTINETTGFDLNYPSITHLATCDTFTKTFTRTVTNVGLAKSEYKVKVQVKLNADLGDQSLEVKVVPDTLWFSAIGEKQSFAITLKGTVSSNSFVSASMVWDDGTHQVRSPIVVFRMC